MIALDQSKVRRILIRAVNWVGDAVMTTPAICNVRESFPKAEITVLANPLVAQLFSPHGCVDRIITFDRHGSHKGIIGRFRLAAELRKHRFDIAVILPNSFDSALVPWLAGIPVRLGKNSDGRGFMLTGRYLPTADTLGCHEVEYYLHLVEHFGIRTNTKKLCLETTAEEKQRITAMLLQHGIQSDDFILGINPGAAYGSAKRWYPERFAEAARQLSETWRARVLVFGGPAETDIAAAIEEKLGKNCLNLAGKTSVRELMEIIRRCNFLITNDSGPMHIAAAFAVPLVAIFGSTDHATTSPYTDNAVIVRKEFDCAPCKLRQCPSDHRCMQAVSAADVVEAAIALFHKSCTQRGKI